MKSPQLAYHKTRRSRAHILGAFIYLSHINARITKRWKNASNRISRNSISHRKLFHCSLTLAAIRNGAARGSSSLPPYIWSEWEHKSETYNRILSILINAKSSNELLFYWRPPLPSARSNDGALTPLMTHIRSYPSHLISSPNCILIP